MTTENPKDCAICTNKYGMVYPKNNKTSIKCEKLEIKNCKLGQFKNGVESCIICESDYQLSINKKKCIKLASSTVIDYC